jgi:hypothetical protein
LHWSFWRWVLANYLPQLEIAELQSLKFSLPSSKDYRHEPPVPSWNSHLYKKYEFKNMNYPKIGHLLNTHNKNIRKWDIGLKG